MYYHSVGSPLCLPLCGHTETLVNAICSVGYLVEVLEHRYYSCFLAKAAL